MKELLKALVTKQKNALRIIGMRNLALLFISLIVTLASVLFNDSWLLASRDESKELSKLHLSALEIAKLEINLLSAESAQRGYLLTNSEDYIKPYDQAVEGARKNIVHIREIFHSINVINAYEKESKLLNQMSNNIASKVSEMDMTLKLVDQGGLKEAKKITHLDSGLNEMKKFSIHSDKLQTLLNQRIVETYQSRKLKRSIARTSTILSPLILLSLVILIIKQLIEELSKKASLQITLSEEIHNHREALDKKSKMLHTLALEQQSDAEKERYKLAREIHDELGSILTATKMDISWTIKTLKDTQPKIAEKLNKTKTYIDQGINFKRQIVEDLHPSTISTFGFWPALKMLVEDAAERGSWELNLTLPESNLQLNETIGIVIYRIIQETLNNTIKYAKANAVSVHIIHDHQQLKIEIEDDGIGLDPETNTDKSHGMRGMQNRVNALGGHLEFSSTPNQGLSTLAILPLDISSDK